MSKNYLLNLDAPYVVNLTTTTARSSMLPEGKYVISSDYDCYFLQGGSTVVATAFSRALYGGTYRELDVAVQEYQGYVAGITGTGIATMKIERIG